MDTNVIIILIGCATVLALAAIICDFVVEREMTDSPESVLSKKIIKIHRNYIAGILGFAVIMLLTGNYGGPSSGIYQYLSFGSTITSLVLSILAIFVTVSSSSDLYKQFTRIDNATDTIKNVSNQIDGTLEKLTATESNLQNTSNEISKQLDNIVEQIDERLKTRMKETESNLSKQLAESMNSSSNKIEEQIPKINQQIVENLKKYFITTSSVNGLLALYACALSKEYGKMFELSNLFSWNLDYTFGFLIASLSIGIIDFTNDDKNNQITCQKTLFHSSELLEEIGNRQRQHDGDMDYFVEKLSIINKYFGIDGK